MTSHVGPVRDDGLEEHVASLPNEFLAKRFLPTVISARVCVNLLNWASRHKRSWKVLTSLAFLRCYSLVPPQAAG